jgi:carbon monoxide dehydrogenase subunit G
MKIDNEFTVSVPIQRAWEVLTDLAGVAPCMPGAQLTGVQDGVYSGKVKIKVGPVISDYSGTAQFVQKDDATYHAVIDAKGKDSRGNGNANAAIDAQLHPAGDRTRVVVSTDLNITGKIAQFGSSMIKEVSEKLLGQFVQNLEAKLLVPVGPGAGVTAEAGTTDAGTAQPSAAASTQPQEAPRPDQAAVPTTGQAPAPPAAPPAPAAAAAPVFDTEEPEPLDLLSIAGGSVYKRLVPVVVGLVVIVAVVIYLVAR